MRRQPELAYAARETAPGAYKFQAVVNVGSRNGEQMIKTFDPHARLLTEQETRQLGHDTIRLVANAREQRIGLPQFQWRHHTISWQDLW
jgi:hypothetical protein